MAGVIEQSRTVLRLVKAKIARGCGFPPGIHTARSGGPNRATVAAATAAVLTVGALGGVTLAAMTLGDAAAEPAAAAPATEAVPPAPAGEQSPDAGPGPTRYRVTAPIRAPRAGVRVPAVVGAPAPVPPPAPPTEPAPAPPPAEAPPPPPPVDSTTTTTTSPPTGTDMPPSS